MPIHKSEHDFELWCYRRRRGKVTFTRSLLPRKCFLSKKPLFLKKSVKVTSKIDGPGTPVIIETWVDAKEFLLDELRR